jgi:hypothetical protein
MANWVEKNYPVLPVSLSRVPEYCKIVRIEPQAVDFIILK